MPTLLPIVRHFQLPNTSPQHYYWHQMRTHLLISSLGHWPSTQFLLSNNLSLWHWWKHTIIFSKWWPNLKMLPTHLISWHINGLISITNFLPQPTFPTFPQLLHDFSPLWHQWQGATSYFSPTMITTHLIQSLIVRTRVYLSGCEFFLAYLSARTVTTTATP